MELDEIINNYGIEFAIEKVAIKINKKIKEYEPQKGKDIQRELKQLLKDRDKIYSNDLKVIKKYLDEE